jgi:hypothetical protein
MSGGEVNGRISFIEFKETAPSVMNRKTIV